MRPSILVFLLIFLAVATATAADPPLSASKPVDISPDLPPQPPPDRDAIAKAVRETLSEAPDAPHASRAVPLRAQSYDKFRRRFDAARVPGCLRPDALKLQPPVIGNVRLTGEFALPFLSLAILRGKCN